MLVEEVLQQLESFGKEQYRKIYARHGVKGPQFGVSTADMKSIQKKIKRDHALAIQLWDSGYNEARELATLIADPAQVTDELAEKWVRELDNYGLTGYFADLIAKTPMVREKMETWIKSEEEWIGRAGWTLLAIMAAQDMSLPDSYFEPYLADAELRIHTAKNRIRDAMNNAIINIGLRNEALREKAYATAERIGEIDVDHGDTACETPNAIAYIERTLAYREKKKKKA